MTAHFGGLAGDGGAQGVATQAVGGAAAAPQVWQTVRPAGYVLGWCGPARWVFERRRLQALWAAWSSPTSPLRAYGLLQAQGGFRTARAWYGWQWPAGGVVPQEIVWRADNRLELLAESPIDPQIVEVALQSARVNPDSR